MSSALAFKAAAFAAVSWTLVGCGSGGERAASTTARSTTIASTSSTPSTTSTTSTTSLWCNWDGVHCCSTIAVHYPTSEQDVVDAVKSAVARGGSLKPFGSGHSYSRVGACDDGGEMMSLALMNATVDVDKAQKTITVQAGKRLHELYIELEANGLALPSVGNIMAQSVAGALSTATHGCNAAAGSISSAVVGLRLVLANGTAMQIDGGDFLMAARASLGALGVITEVTLQAIRSYKLRTPSSDDQVHADTDVFMRSHVEYAKSNPYTHLFFYSRDGEFLNRMIVRTQEVCTDAEENCEVWYKAQTRTDTPDGADQLIKTYETEINVNANQASAVVDAFRGFLAEHADDLDERVDWSFSARYVGAEETWLAPAYNRLSLHLTLLMHCKNNGEAGAYFWTFAGVSNSVRYGFESPVVAGERVTDEQLQHLKHQGVDMADAVEQGDFGEGFLVPCTSDWIQRHLAIFGRALERIAYQHGGRPHLGKENTVTAEHLAKAYPRYGDFIRLRAELDPTGVFMTSHLQQRLMNPSEQVVM